MTQTQVAYADGNWCCYRTDDARKRRFVGCRHRSPASAIAHSDYIARHDAASGAAPTPIPEPLFSGSGSLGAAPESVRADSPDSRGPG